MKATATLSTDIITIPITELLGLMPPETLTTNRIVYYPISGGRNAWLTHVGTNRPNGDRVGFLYDGRLRDPLQLKFPKSTARESIEAAFKVGRTRIFALLQGGPRRVVPDPPKEDVPMGESLNELLRVRFLHRNRGAAIDSLLGTAVVPVIRISRPSFITGVGDSVKVVANPTNDAYCVRVGGHNFLLKFPSAGHRECLLPPDINPFKSPTCPCCQQPSGPPVLSADFADPK